MDCLRVECGTNSLRSQFLECCTQAICVAVKNSHHCTGTNSGACCGYGSDSGTYHRHFTRQDSGNASQEDTLAVYGVCEERRSNGDRSPAVYFGDNVRKRHIAPVVANLLYCHGDYALLHKCDNALTVTVFRVEHSEQQSTATQLAYFVLFQRCEVDNDVAGESLVTSHNFGTVASITAVSIVNGISGTGFYFDNKAPLREDIYGFRSERETSFRRVCASRQSDTENFAMPCRFLHLRQSCFFIINLWHR